jgi:hypothetical protein
VSAARLAAGTIKGGACVALFLVLAGCATTPPQPDLSWIEGCWENPAHTQRERWLPAQPGKRDGRSEGEGTLLKNGQVVFRETLWLEPVDGVMTYLAAPNGRPAVAFKLTAAGPGAAVFENPAHDDPKRIRYQRNGDQLRAWTGPEGGEKLVLDARLSACD